MEFAQSGEMDLNSRLEHDHFRSAKALFSMEMMLNSMPCSVHLLCAGGCREALDFMG
jgi:hypothetical protein